MAVTRTLRLRARRYAERRCILCGDPLPVPEPTAAIPEPTPTHKTCETCLKAKREKRRQQTTDDAEGERGEIAA